MNIQALYNELEARIPATLSCPWDNDGLSVCAHPDAPVTGIVVALDLTEDAIRKAEESGSLPAGAQGEKEKPDAQASRHKRTTAYPYGQQHRRPGQ